MKQKKLISFDLQGTLSNSSFSDEFWLELLPTLYAEKNGITFLEASERLESAYQKTGKYHEAFYNHRIRLNEILGNWEFQDVIKRIESPAEIYADRMQLLDEIPGDIPVIIVSATTRDFIDHELGEHKSKFFDTFSAIDDFSTPGKPPHIFEKVASMMEVAPQNCLHLGDCREMDYQNSTAAGWISYHLDKKKSPELVVQEMRHVIAEFLNNTPEQ